MENPKEEHTVLPIKLHIEINKTIPNIDIKEKTYLEIIYYFLLIGSE